MGHTFECDIADDLEEIVKRLREPYPEDLGAYRAAQHEHMDKSTRYEEKDDLSISIVFDEDVMGKPGVYYLILPESIPAPMADNAEYLMGRTTIEALAVDFVSSRESGVSERLIQGAEKEQSTDFVKALRAAADYIDDHIEKKV